MVKYLNEAFDNSSARILGSQINKHLKNALASKGIDIRQLVIGNYPGDVSNRSPLWRQTVDAGVSNGQMLGFLFPSGYVYVAGFPNDQYMDSADHVKGDGWNLTYYSQLSRQEVARRAMPIIISNVLAKPDKERYKDPRYNDYGKYAGQYLNKDYDPNSSYSWDRQKWRNSSPGRRDSRDKSGYALRSLADLKSDLIKKYKSGNIDEELFNRFKNSANKLKALFNRIKDVDMSSMVIDYSKDYNSDMSYADRTKTDKIARIQRYAVDALQYYRKIMEESNQDRRWAFHGGERDLARTVTRLDDLNKDIDKLNMQLDEFLSM